MTTYSIENKVETAFVSYLEASDDIDDVRSWADGSSSNSLPAVIVRAQLQESMVANGFQNNVSVELMCITHADDDKSGTICDGLVTAVRNQIRNGSAISLINAVADSFTVIGLIPESDSFSDEIERRHMKSVTCEIMITN